MTQCDLVQFSYKSKELRIDRVRYDADVFAKIYQLLAPVAETAAKARAAAQLPEDAHVAPLDPFDRRDLVAEIEDMLKTHVERIV